jgi:hypothetical protein
MPARNEFRGHDCSEETQLTLLNAVNGLGLRVAAVLYEKVSETQAALATGKSTDFEDKAALKLFRKFAGQYQVSKLWCDQDTEGRQEQKAFETALQRVHRELYPDGRFEARHKASHQSDLIQMADIIAYGLSRHERALVENADLRRVLSILRKDTRNIIEGPLEWGQ